MDEKREQERSWGSEMGQTGTLVQMLHYVCEALKRRISVSIIKLTVTEAGPKAHPRLGK